jgi:hypothetical protein
LCGLAHISASGQFAIITFPATVRPIKASVSRYGCAIRSSGPPEESDFFIDIPV